ncbi:MAG: alpha/beta fold hydrolase [Acidobacteria bacterium]|nr:alpha/beta fold hydrolase [Acidobacteriota bacterium]
MPATVPRLLLLAALTFPSVGSEDKVDPLRRRAAFPKEAYSCCDVLYDSVLTDRGQRVRTIVTRPKGAAGRLPAVLFVGWLSCDSVEQSLEAEADGWGRTLRGLVTDTGMVTMRVDKPGAGDSEGVCSETDYEGEVAAYRAALEALRRSALVDPDAIALFGGSMGGATAPLVAQGQKLRGVAVWGTFAKSWLEHMLEQERRRLALAGDPPGRVGEKMRGYGELYGLFLTQKLAPREVLRRSPHLSPLWHGGPEDLYGRPASFHHQAQDLNLPAAWEALDVPVLSIHGEYDWIMSREDQQMIVDVVNRAHPGRARFVGAPKTDHHFMAFDDPEAAFRDEGGRWNREVLDEVVGWLKEVTAPASAAAKASPSSFDASVRPVLERRCVPCHFPGGSMYARLPFDAGETIRSHREGVLRRLKGDDRAAVEAWLGPAE